MSVLLTSEGSTRVLVGTTVNLLPDKNTVLAWVYPTSINSTYQALYERTVSDFSDYRGLGVNGTNGELSAFMRRGSPGYTGISVTKTNLLVANTWQFVGGQMDATVTDNTAQKLFYGTLSTPAAEVTGYNSQTAGTGATSAPANCNVYIGNSADLAAGFPGRIAWLAVWSRLLTLGEIIDQQFNPHKTANCEGMYQLFSTSHLADLSGNLRNGTNTGTTNAPHVPIGKMV